MFTGVIDDSGIRLTITKTLRSKEVSLLEIGHKVSYKQVVPPHQKAFVSKAYCSQGCIRKVRSVLPDLVLFCEDLNIDGSCTDPKRLGQKF